MLVPEILGRKFIECRRGLAFVADRAKEALIPFCEQQGFAFAFRTKTVESLAEKIETGRYGGWSKLDDLWAATIVVPTLQHEATAINFCERVFDATVKHRGTTKKSPEVFRFDSPRITCRLRPPPDVDSPRTECFEVQVRTAFEHAWSAATHALAYKTSEVSWKRARLAAQIKATVEQLDTLILAFDSTLQRIPESPWPEFTAKATIVALVRKWSECGIIPNERLPKDPSRFADNVYQFLRVCVSPVKIEELLERFSKVMQGYPPARFPRSISLWQWFVAELIERDLLRPRDGMTWHITDEVTVLYPRTKSIAPELRFDYETAGM